MAINKINYTRIFKKRILLEKNTPNKNELKRPPKGLLLNIIPTEAIAMSNPHIPSNNLTGIRLTKLLHIMVPQT